jgi:hypothetical protein
MKARILLSLMSILKNVICEGTPAGCWNGRVGCSQNSSSHSIGGSTSNLVSRGKHYKYRALGKRRECNGMNEVAHSSWLIEDKRPRMQLERRSRYTSIQNARLNSSRSTEGTSMRALLRWTPMSCLLTLHLCQPHQEM